MKFFSKAAKKEINTDEYMSLSVKVSDAPPARMGSRFISVKSIMNVFRKLSMLQATAK